MSQFPLPPLSDRVPVVVVAAAVVYCHCHCPIAFWCGVPDALGGKDMLAMLLISDVLTLLMLIMDC